MKGIDQSLEAKGAPGELFLKVAVGYVRAGRDRIEKDANLRVREAWP
ncbi:hypothetical protein [Mesorhizobium sp. M1A.F.Ca.ET.072.01.1.1]|nr:hypothetical protein [Mesorhizobium sp. M1A.F.Ca.ET.072.01.1.1]